MVILDEVLHHFAVMFGEGLKEKKEVWLFSYVQLFSLLVFISLLFKLTSLDYAEYKKKY